MRPEFISHHLQTVASTFVLLVSTLLCHVCFFSKKSTNRWWPLPAIRGEIRKRKNPPLGGGHSRPFEEPFCPLTNIFFWSVPVTQIVASTFVFIVNALLCFVLRNGCALGLLTPWPPEIFLNKLRLRLLVGVVIAVAPSDNL